MCKFSKIYVLYILFIYIHTKSFLLCLRQSIKKKKTDGEIRKQKLNEMGTLDMK